MPESLVTPTIGSPIRQMQTLETGSAPPVTKNVEADANTEKEKQEFRDFQRYLQMKVEAQEAV